MLEKSKFSPLYRWLLALRAKRKLRDPYGRHDLYRTGNRLVRVEYDLKLRQPTISYHKRITEEDGTHWWYEKYAMVFAYGDVGEDEFRVDRALKLVPLRFGRYPVLPKGDQ